MIRFRFIARTAALFLFLLLGGTAAFAQFSSGIEGTVHDSSGAVVSGAQVSITDTRLGVTKTATTSDSGYFRIDAIAASNYTIQISGAGFDAFKENNLTLQVGEIRNLEPVLKIGSAATTEVIVSAPQASLNLSAAATGSVISQETVSVTPLGGQNVYGLTSLTPGVTGSGTNSTDNFTNEYAININAAGLRQEENGYQIDNAYTDTPSRAGGTSISPNPEIVDSISILANNFDAGKGRNGGATVDVFTKSGSNKFHGTGDYYFLNNNLTTRTEFQSTVPTFKRQEMGLTAGGPIFKNKLFFYGAIDVLRSSAVSASAYTVETQAFDQWAAANLPNNLATQILALAPPLVYPTTGLLTASQVIAQTPSYFPLPANLPANLPILGTANISYSVPKNAYQYSVRGDDYIGLNDRVYAEFMRTYDTSVSATPRAYLNYDQANSSDFANIDWTHTFNSHLLNEAGANMIRPFGSDLPTPGDAIPFINVTGLTGFANWGPGNFTQTTVGWRDVLSATVKTQTIKFGFQQDNIREVDSQSGAFDRPTYNFNNILDFVQDEATSQSATPVSLLTHEEAPYNRRYRALVTGIFVQDDWKVTPRLTLNGGLRYDSMQNFFAVLSPSLTNFNLGTGDYNASVASGTVNLAPNTHVLDHSIWDLTPRVGFSYDLFGNGRTALRGGYGVFADQPPYIHVTDITAGNLPNYYSPSISVYQGQPTPTFQLCSAPVGFTEACPVVNTANVTLNASGGITGQRANVGGYSPDYKLTQVQQWSLSVQHQFASNLIMEINYSASTAHHLPVFNQDANRFSGDLVVNKGVLTRLNPNFGAITYGSSDGNSVGHYGSATLTRLISHGFAIRGIYTIGKALDTFSNSGSLDGGAITTSTQQILNGNLNAQYGRADFDIHQQFSTDGTWTLPNHFSNRIEKNILGGWQAGGLWLFHTGLPFTVYNGAGFNPVFNAAGQVIANTGGDYNADGSNYDVPNTPSFGPHLSGQSRSKFRTGLFPASAFPTPALGTEGNLGRNTYDQPGYNNFDFTMAKLFTTKWFGGNRLNLEAKAEAYNLFNRVNLTGVTSDLSSSQFGQSTTELQRYTGGRSVQIHIRGNF
ncbi:TonB-dependent receptor [Acidipila sp. EB88]|uniref:TonB-dependent receptor n=1 Tax=Acidipila sp. EB88 TaxID=2305226 RepID=UPI000F5DA0DB|nr:TonB-dependent receptor [Acidipila sp. EB88]RRA48249.1 TonB-dependent receptor [Acidipila sp. EB88]